MLFGILWAAFAPLSLVGCFALIFFLTRNARLSKRHRILISFAATIIPVLLLWAPSRIEFARVCKISGTPVILKTIQADGFYLDDSTANSFGMRYLRDEGFRWIEAKSTYHRDKYTRYGISDGKISESEVEKLTARYVLTSHLKEYDSYSDTEFVVADRVTGETLASAHSMHFDGGAARWVLGAWGVASCPSAMTGAEDFQKMYHLAKLTLRSERKDEK
jgi:hypothetical protein